MTITSTSFENNGYIPRRFTCDGENTIPELDISGVPAGAKSLALIMHDPDAPMAGGFTHWLVWNIDPKTSVIEDGDLPAGSIEGKNGSGTISYVGPCPPSGVHHYHFTIYALSAVIDLKSGSDKKSLEAEINRYLLAQAVSCRAVSKIIKNMEQAGVDEPKKEEYQVIREWREGDKRRRLIREISSTPANPAEHDVEEVEEEIIGEPGYPSGSWHKIFLSDCEILHKYEDDQKRELRDVIFSRMVKGEDRVHPKEEAVVSFKATQELVNDEWVTVPGSEVRISKTPKGIM